MLKRILFLTLGIAEFSLFVGCSSSPRPPDADVMAALQKNIPASLQVLNVDFECVPNEKKPGEFDLDGKATISVKENLYQLASAEEIKPINELTDEYNDYIDWLNDRMKTPSSQIIGKDIPEGLHFINFVHQTMKAGDMIGANCTFTAEQQGDHWIVNSVDVSWQLIPTMPLSKFPPAAVAVNSPEGEAAISKMKAQLDILHGFQKNSEIRIKEANRAFSVKISDWIKSGKSYSGIYQDMAFNRIRHELIKIHFSHYEPDTMTFQGEVTFITVHNAVMGFQGNIRDSMLNLHDMKVLKDPEELTPDDHWALTLDEKGNLSGEYPGGPITIYAK